MGVKFAPIPIEVKPIAHLLKLAEEHDDRNIVVAYWARMAACRLALKLVPGKKSPETANLIRTMLDWLETTKQENSENEGITNETAAQAIIENYALKMFEYGDQQDKAEVFNKNTVKTFYTAGMLMDVLDQFGSLPDEVREKRKYAKWKAAYIHNCLKQGEQPMPGPPREPNVDPEMNIVPNNLLTQEEMSSFTEYQGPSPPDVANLKRKDSKGVETPTTPGATPTSPPNYGRPPSSGAQEGGVPFAFAPQPSPVSPGHPSTDPLPPLGAIGSVASGVPDPAVTPRQPSSSGNGSGYQPTPEVMQKAQKFCKYATSALNYDDVKNALENIEKARNLLLTGNE
ncbi:unnamed protein product [Callosobruchus maculatus]|uniref:Vta1/callose synthase N-terminal domain-containing protein n=1 Tax=Callosobruchus maculatus TaxID=64391 RepID=A0A653D989_CALMS|nr:unnamed protein product [Callosobruchus maculatus]